MVFFEGQTAYYQSLQQTVKQKNLRKIFSLVASEESVSRARIARTTGLTPSTVSVLVDELIGREYVRESCEGVSYPTGRRPTLLTVNPRGMRIPVLSFKKDGILYRQLDCALGETQRFFLAYPWASESAREDREGYRLGSSDEIVSMVKRIFDQSDINALWEKTHVLCLAFVGTFDWEKGTYSSTDIGIRGDIGFLDGIRRLTRNLPMLVCNTSLMRGYAEMALCPQSHCRNMLFLEVSGGVGSGIFLNGRCFTGATGLAGEVGHISVNLDGPRCLCGNRGCLERYVSTQAIQASVLKATGHAMRWDEICDAYKAGSEPIRAVIRDTARYLYIGISNAICVLNVGSVVIGGRIAGLGPEFLEVLRNMAQETGYRKGMGKADIRLSSMPDDSEFLGIARLYQDRYHRFTV